MSAREQVLDAVERLVLEGSPAPTLDAVAAAAGVSKGGLLHHFPDRRALLHGLVLRSVQRTDGAMAEAAAGGRVAETWLRLSADAPDVDTHRAVLALVRLTGSGRLDLPPQVAEAASRWQQMIVTEVGDPVRGQVVRLVGDGLFVAALTGDAPTPAEVDVLVRHLLAAAPGGS